MFGADFGPLAAGPQAARRGPEALALDRGEKRPWLKVFETAPVQMLNAYGEAKYARFGNADLWKNMTKPLKSGAESMTPRRRSGVVLLRTRSYRIAVSSFRSR